MNKVVHNDYPRISVVTSSFNQGNFLRETIESVINQNYPNLEYFIIDGGSTDNSVEIIREYESQIDWWVSEKDKGQSDAINKGFKKSTGELLCWVNSDDILLPGCLQEIASCYLKNKKPDLIHTNFLHIDSEGVIKRMIRIPRQTRFFMYHGVWSVSVPSSFFSAFLFRHVGYLNPDYHISMDLDIWLRMIKAGAKVHYIPKYLGAFRLHQNSKTLNILSSKENRESRFEHEHDRILDTALKGTTRKSRLIWRMVWRFYQLFNFNYLRSFIETVHISGKHWKQVFK
jgi:glycosyltransferase involved in cell wall biosynthesis